DAKMNVRIDESRRNRAVAQIKDLRAACTADRARDLDDGVVFDQNFRRTEQCVTQTVEQFSADDDCFRHQSLPTLTLELTPLHSLSETLHNSSGARISQDLSNRPLRHSDRVNP